MHFFRCDAPTGFKCLEPFVKVYDTHGRVAYSQPNQTGVLWFNLPRGGYQTENTLTRSALRRYKLPKLAQPEKPFKGWPHPDAIKIVVEPNPAKASIVIGTGVITIDETLWNERARHHLFFLLGHEMGHYLYRTEEKCDTFATVRMLQHGFNPSQIEDALNVNFDATRDTSNERAEIQKRHLPNRLHKHKH